MYSSLSSRLSFIEVKYSRGISQCQLDVLCMYFLLIVYTSVQLGNCIKIKPEWYIKGINLKEKEMYTDKRLTQAYKDAQVHYFDDKSKFIIFSDCHRGDDSISDEFTRNQTIFMCALQYYYEKGYTYIEAGDGDELWEYGDFKYIRCAHTDVFTVMKAFYDDNRFIMLYGNHNNLLRNQWYVKHNYYYYYDEYKGKVEPLFLGIKPIESLLLKHKKTGQEILTVHGHQGDLLNDRLAWINKFFLRYFWRYIHVVGFKNPSSPAKNMYKRHKVEKRYSRWIRENQIMLICGHTHRLRFPKKGALPYFNTGCCVRTKGITGIEICNNEIYVVEWRVQAHEDGTLHVARNIIRGPRKISEFYRRGKGKKQE